MLNIYINTWGNYNENGADGGKWITLPMDADDLDAELETIAEAMHDDDPEFFVNDYEFNSEFNFPVSENENLTELNELMQELDGLDSYEQEALAAVIEAHTNNIRQALEIIESGDYTFYKMMTLEDVAEELVEELYTPDTATAEFFARYFDYSAFARDLGFDGYTETAQGVICIY